MKASKSRDTTSGSGPARILIVGGGCVGMYTALRLRARSRPRETEVVLVTPEPYMTYQPFLPEAAAGSISPRHVVVPLRRVLRGCRLLVGEALAVDHAARTALVRTKATDDEGTGPLAVAYDELVMAPGSVSRTLPVPGLEQMDIASSTRDPALRDAALTFVFVGGGYAGVEALGELEDMARYATRHYHNIRPEDMKWVLVEAADRILPEVGPDMGRYTVRELRRRKVDVRLGTRLESCERRVAVLSDGSRHPTRTLVWTAGVKPHPLLAATDLPRDGRGRLRCTPELSVVGAPHAWA
ncbi:NAD(P)/FAD-dependent oxidoreductase, partial [Streptomyces sp. NPDC059909]|uniref:NAD(P)/FAD-dependent oxidoreductase n=1 Tax=Streptomyces sp. NPDC059909 TaxID=3346998 RepID=UPI00364B34D0